MPYLESAATATRHMPGVLANVLTNMRDPNEFRAQMTTGNSTRSWRTAYAPPQDTGAPTVSPVQSSENPPHKSCTPMQIKMNAKKRDNASEPV